MPCRLPELLQALLRMMWDVHTDQGPTPEPVKAALLQGATECLILLDRCSVGQVKVSWGPPAPFLLSAPLKEAAAHYVQEPASVKQDFQRFPPTPGLESDLTDGLVT